MVESGCERKKKKKKKVKSKGKNCKNIKIFDAFLLNEFDIL